ncbi:MAG: DUF3516 domain-containing protein [Collinsella sp.]
MAVPAGAQCALPPRDPCRPRARSRPGRARRRLGHERDSLAKALDAYHEQHEEILTDGDARSAAMFTIDGSDEKTDHVWHVHQIFADEDGDHDFGIMGDVDLDATQDGGEVIFKNYRVGFIEDLLED